LLYDRPEDHLKALLAYVKAGVDNNEYCLWIISGPLSLEDARAALSEALGAVTEHPRRESVEIFDWEQWHRSSGRFDVKSSFERLIEVETASLAKGFDGLRVANCVPVRETDEWHDSVVYESMLRTFLPGRSITSITSYCVGNCSAVGLVDIINTHSHTMALRDETWELVENSPASPLPAFQNGYMNYSEIASILGIRSAAVRKLLTRKSSPGTEVGPPPAMRLLTCSEIASILKIHPNTVRRWSDSGALPTFRLGNRNDRRFRLSDVNRLMSHRATGATSPDALS
jgi:excisionase family DNA binding protein